MIVRGERPADRFAQISNAALADERLSFRARGLLAHLLSLPIGWTTDSVALAKGTKEGRDAIRTALNELVDHGYLVRVRSQDAQGQWRTDVHVTDIPSPTPDFQASVDQSSVDQAVKTKKETNTKTPPTPRKRGARTPVEYSPDFEVFWEVYPRRSGKRTAYAAFTKALDRRPLDEIMGGALRYASDPNREPRFTKHPATWLNADGWDDDPLPPRSGRMSANEAVARTLAGSPSDDPWAQMLRGQQTPQIEAGGTR